MNKKFKKILHSRIFTLIVILLFIAVCMGIGAVTAYIRHESDPTEQAVKYFRAFMQQDYKQMYSLIDVKEGYYIDRDRYEEIMKKSRMNTSIDSYEIKEPVKENGQYLVVITCTDNQTETSHDMKIYLNKKRKGLQIVPDYYVDIDSMIVDNFTIIVPKGDSLELNDKAIDNKLAKVITDKNGNQVFRFKGIINGEYKISAINQYYAVNHTENIVRKDMNIDLTKEDYTLNEKYNQMLEDNGSQVMNQFYKAVRNRNPKKPKLLEYFNKDKKLIKKIKAYVEESEDIVYWQDTKNIENYHVTEMNINDLKSKIKVDTDKNQVTLSYKYNYDYVSSTDTELYSSYVYTLSGNCKSQMKLVYQIEGENLILTDIRITNNNNKH